jgi:hypothetical protein
MRCTLREVRDEDLAALIEQWADPVAAHTAAFTAPDHMDRDAFFLGRQRQRGSPEVHAVVISSHLESPPVRRIRRSE